MINFVFNLKIYKSIFETKNFVDKLLFFEREMLQKKSHNFLFYTFLPLIFLIFSPFHLIGQINFVESEPLSSEEAFQIDFVVNSPTETVIRWRINNFYYLYKKKISFSSEDFIIEEVKLPVAQIKEDPFFGKSEVYYEIVEATLTLRPKTQGIISRILTVKYQGCWEGGVCYPVEKALLKL